MGHHPRDIDGRRLGAGVSKKSNLYDNVRAVAMRRDDFLPIFDFDCDPQVVLVASNSRIPA